MTEKAESKAAPLRLQLIFNPVLLLPPASIGLALLLQLVLPRHEIFITKPLTLFTNFLTASLAVIAILTAISLVNERVRQYLTYRALFIAAAYLFLNGYNLITSKFSLVVPLFFPAPDLILNVFQKDGPFLLKCLYHSFRLLALGFSCGAAAGFLTGVVVGWSRTASYWVMPLIKFVGPIPSTAWIPVALVIFFSSYSASVFLIALAVWFPTTVLTSSGIQNVEKTYFEVASTLGASTFRQILTVAIPGALPSVFVGLFNGTCTAFLTLMSAEMIGVKFGIGWYVNWKREVMAYANVYAGLILIAVTCSLLISLLFKFRDRTLKWQKEVIRW